MYKVFLDTNILLDYILDDRGNCQTFAEQIIDQCIRGEIACYIAPHSLTNIFYILRKVCSPDCRKEIIKMFCDLCQVVPIDEGMLLEAAELETKDFEDALQLVCAKRCGASKFITRDKQLDL